MPPSYEPVLNHHHYHSDLNKIMKNGPNHCPFCGNAFNLEKNSFARLECKQCPFNPEIYDENTEAYNYIDFYIEVLDSTIIVECGTRFLKSSYNHETHVLSLPLNLFNINDIDALRFKLKTYILFS